MDRRPQLQSLLETLLGSDNVYFQPPPNIQLQYPAIVYKRNNADTKFGDNYPYRVTQRYLVTLISEDPDDATWQKLVALQRCLHERWYAVNDLNHDVFNLYF